ncbi:MAG: alkaline phosphatase [Anaerolineae bacterium]|nr:alkaline phosphatase [Anaerolineae bacterium]
MINLKKWGIWIVLVALATMLSQRARPATTAMTATTTFVPAGAVWKYLDNGSNQGTAWRGVGFNDSAWDSGPAQLGYGDGDEVTTVGYGPNSHQKYITTYFRHTFTVTTPSAYQYLKLNVLKDDGAIVYLNGAEIYRYNMPAGPIGYETLAASEIPQSAEGVFSNATVSATLLVTGTNVLAVEIHQVNRNNDDISFDLSLASTITTATAPRNVILFIGDGMGPEQVKAAGIYQNGAPGTLFMESLPYTSTMTTYSANNAVTDSAASSTAMATGIKVNNYVVAQARPGDGHDLEDLVERFHRACKSAGLVTTAFATHATPAGFGAHTQDRYNYAEIANDYLTWSRPDVLLGGGANGLTPAAAINAGYDIVTNRVEMQALNPLSVDRVSGQFGADHLPYEYQYYIGAVNGYDTLPHLSEMVSATLPILDTDPEGFFLMVEGARIDHAGHSNLLPENIFETLELDRAIEIAYNWAMSRTDTLIIVTADHETGGLTVLQNNGAGNWPTVSWSSLEHTATPVQVFAWGVNALLATEVHDNTDIYWLARAGLAEACLCDPAVVQEVNVKANNRHGVIHWGWLILAGLGLGITPRRSRTTSDQRRSSSRKIS